MTPEERDAWGRIVEISIFRLEPLLAACGHAEVDSQRNVANEVRNALAHIEWAYSTGAPRVEQLGKARTHLARACLDASKALFRAQLADGSACAKGSFDAFDRYAALVERSLADGSLAEWYRLVLPSHALSLVPDDTTTSIVADDVTRCIDAVRRARAAERRLHRYGLALSTETAERCIDLWDAIRRCLMAPSPEADRALGACTDDFVTVHRELVVQLAVGVVRACGRYSRRRLGAASRVASERLRDAQEAGNVSLDALADLAETMLMALDEEHPGIVARLVGAGAHLRAFDAETDLVDFEDVPTSESLLGTRPNAVVWFADLVGSSRMYGNPDGELELERYHAAFAEGLQAATSVGGLLAANTWGDGVHAGFDHEALGLLCLRRFVDAFHRRGGIAPLRIGVAFGAVTVRSNPITRLDVTGFATLEAARLEPCARADGARAVEAVALPEHAERLRRAGVAFEPVTRRSAKALVTKFDADAEVALLRLALDEEWTSTRS